MGHSKQLSQGYQRAIIKGGDQGSGSGTGGATSLDATESAFSGDWPIAYRDCG
jgi:hypothetical protein